MKTKILLFILLLTTQFTFSQVGIGTTNPQGALDVVSTNAGLVVPRVSSLEVVTDTQGNPPQNGTIVFDELRQKTCHYINGKWACVGFAANGTVESTLEIPVSNDPITYVKASNTEASDFFGYSISISGDGSRLAVASLRERSNATGINGNQNDNSASSSGAVYVFSRSGTTWTQEAYIKASNTDAVDFFGYSISISGDGSRLAVGANNEDSNATGINGNQNDNSTNRSGAVYMFSRSGTTWTQEAYIKASNTEANDEFGRSITISDDGSRLAVGAINEDSNAAGINGNQNDNSASNSGAVYVFSRSGTTWTQEAYIKASNTATGDQFGNSISISNDGSRLAISAYFEDSNATGINGDQNNNSANGSGAIYVYSRSGTSWTQEAYIKASNTEASDQFGYSISISNDGSRLAVSAFAENSNAIGVNGNQGDNSAINSGAVYVFSRSGTTWTQEAYIKASNTEVNDFFGYSISMSGDGSRLVSSAFSDDSCATGTNGNDMDNSLLSSGAAYLFEYEGGNWSQTSYIKASNTGATDQFGSYVTLNNDGSYFACSAPNEDSNATGFSTDTAFQLDNSAIDSGAVYIYNN